MTTKKSKSEDNPDMHILKTSTCKTLSGKSTLTYQIGSTPDSVVHLRITKNTGGGFFSNEWIAYDAVQAALKKRREGQAITSFLLIPLFKGKSANNSSFLLAALKHLKLVKPLPNKTREHEPLDPRPFLDQVDKLMSSSVKAKAPTRRPTKKTVTKKASVKKASIKKAAIKRASAKKHSANTRKTSST
jgi:hypothetical protein